MQYGREITEKTLVDFGIADHTSFSVPLVAASATS
jgi:hypothetical protein